MNRGLIEQSRPEAGSNRRQRRCRSRGTRRTRSGRPHRRSGTRTPDAHSTSNRDPQSVRSLQRDRLTPHGLLLCATTGVRTLESSSGSAGLVGKECRTRYAVPPAPRRYVPRRRLYDTLDRGAECPVTAVVGPPGCGKTVAVASWVAKGPNAQTVWMSCEERDADPVHFWHGAVEALQRHWPPLAPTCVICSTRTSHPSTTWRPRSPARSTRSASRFASWSTTCTWPKKPR